MPGVPMTELRSNGVATLTAPSDLWDRIRDGFALPDLQSAEVARQQAWYLERPDTIQRMAERSRRYLFHIVEQLELRAMPTELALLPYVESAFNPQAISSAKAAGLWQFIPSTGTLFNLDQNAWRDDRRNVLASTSAALDYLQELHDEFDDWHLALAAYNWGPGNVGRAIARNAAAGLGTAYTDLKKPNETAQYVPRLQALKNIIATPEAFDVALPSIPNHPYFDTVTITKDIDVLTAAQLAAISEDDFKALNPSFKRPVIVASGTAQILLPWDNANRFRQSLAESDPAALATWTLWQSPTEVAIEDVAKRFAMSVRDLRRLNALPRHTRHIASGTTIMVRETGSQLASAPATGARVRVATAPAATAVATPSVLKRTVVQARTGDSITHMAARYDLPAETVAEWNETREDDALQSGRDIVLYLPDQLSGTAVQPGKVQVGSPAAVARAAASSAPAPAAAEARASTQPARGKVAVAAAAGSSPAPAPEPPQLLAQSNGKVRVQTARN
ncbi:MAG: transglycosylase SLT domain-containing protein [Ottowia sp.]|nr:transglycosylase SLT domain-containing protein [Ottowia sp.]